MQSKVLVRQVGGYSAILAGVAQLSWVILNVVTGGGLDAGDVAAGPAPAGLLLILFWNILLMLAAIMLGIWLMPKGRYLVLLSTLCGVVSCLLWAFFNLSSLEAVWILLSAAWLLGLGFVLQGEYRISGIFTMVVGFAALLDGVVTFLNLPPPFWVVGGFKIPLFLIWSFWIGLLLLFARNVSASFELAPKK